MDGWTDGQMDRQMETQKGVSLQVCLCMLVGNSFRPINSRAEPKAAEEERAFHFI